MDFHKEPKTVKKSLMKKTLKLLCDKHSTNLVNRHCCAIHKLNSTYKNGVLLKDVFLLVEIIKRCHELLVINSVYEDLVCNLMQLFSVPFLKRKVSDENNYVRVLSDCLRELGKLAETSTEKIQTQIACNISSLYTANQNNFVDQDHHPVSGSMIRRAVEISGLCHSLAMCFIRVSDGKNKCAIVDSLKPLTDTYKNCEDMLQADLASYLCMELPKQMKNYRLMFGCVEVLWNLLEQANQENVIEQINTDESLYALSRMLTQQTENSASIAHQELRNDMLVVIATIARMVPTLTKFNDSRLTKCICVYVTHPEFRSDQEKCLPQSPHDFEFKKHAIMLLVELGRDRESLRIMCKHNVFKALFAYVIYARPPTVECWSEAEFKELQLESMTVLATLSPLVINEYMECQGNTRLLLLLEWCVGTDIYDGHSNCFHGIGGHGNKRAQMRYCIRLLRSVSSTGNEIVLRDLTDQGAIAQLVAILSCSCSTEKSIELDEIGVEMQCDMLLILSLMTNDAHNKELVGEGGVKMLLGNIQGYLNSSNGSIKLLVSAINAIWCSIVGCDLNEMIFLANGGVFLLLDVLQVCPSNIQNVVLSNLLDLTENLKCLKHIEIWRGEADISVGKLLIDIWLEEERLLRVKRSEDGVITAIEEPLATKYKLQSKPCNAIADVTENMRANIFSLFLKLDFDHVQGLDCHDYVTFALLKHYLDFKTLEVWQEIRDELRREGIQPVPTDQECMDSIIEILQDTAQRTVDLQNFVLQKNKEKEMREEIDYYRKWKEGDKQKDKARDDFRCFVGRTSNIERLKQARHIQLRHIDETKICDKELKQQCVVSHTTIERKLQTTTFGGHLVVKSTKSNVKPLKATQLPVI